VANRPAADTTAVDFQVIGENRFILASRLGATDDDLGLGTRGGSAFAGRVFRCGAAPGLKTRAA
jgi:hypothetical protein